MELSDKLASTQPGHLYVMLGDSLQGFYIVKCLSSQDDCFTGRYLQQIFESESDGRCILYKETKEKDKFMYNSLVYELFGCSEIHDKGLSFPVFSVDKCELDEILITIGDLDEI